MQRKNPGKQQGPKGLHLGHLSPRCAGLLGSHTPSRGAEQLPASCVALIMSVMGRDMGACDSAGANQSKIMSFSHHHGLGLPSWPQCLPPPPHLMSRASSVSIFEMGQKAIESWVGIGEQRLMWLLGWTQDMNRGPSPSLPVSESQGLFRGSPGCPSPKPLI